MSLANLKRTAFDIANANISLQESGDRDGSPMLFLHGHPDSGALWLKTVQHMDSNDYHYLMPDLPGWGRSTATSRYNLSLENRAQFIEEVFRASEVDLIEEEPVSLVVHDHGGPFGLAWAVLNPEHIRALVIVNTIFHRDYEWHFWARLWRTRGVGEVNMFLQRFLRPIVRMEMKRGSRGLPDDYIHETLNAIKPKTRQMALRLYRATDPDIFTGWDDRLYDLVGKIPTLVLWGEKDPYIPMDFALRLKEYGAELHSYPEYGHWLMAEAPEVVAHRIKSFLRDL